ncbi:MAG: ABC transporter ATP-binding protein [Chloroflexota bacterium]|nr:ABC transporter ATP-binding protein [Chloroflexota bacterium]
MLLELQSVSTYYGRIQALKGVSLHVDEGEIVALVGANGAGKTTLLKTISGLLHPASGQIRFEGKDITYASPAEIVQVGISHVPEHRQVFGTMTVRDNLLLGAYQRYWRVGKQAVERDLERVYSIFPVLRERRKQLAGTMSGGEQQMLAIGRGMMARPKLMLFDEPSLGLAPLIVKDLFRVIADLREEGMTILLVEQNARAALRLADRGYVLETGEVALSGEADDLLSDKRVQEAYLGGTKPPVTPIAPQSP